MARIERTKNAARNVLVGTMLKVYQIIVPFFMRTAMIYLLGIQYLGLNSLFASVLEVLNLAELGVGAAMVFSMYKPIADDDKTTICALMKLYKLYYRIIGAVIAVAGVLLIPFIPKLIKSDVPEGINIYLLYLLNLASTVLSYWMFAYKSSILRAHQRNDVISSVSLLTSTIQYVLQLLALWLLHNYYVFVIVTLFTQMVTNLITAYYSNKLYPQYKAEGQLPKEMVTEINRKIRDLFTSKIGAIVVNSADTIVISAFLGLTTLAIYQNYYFILTAVIGFITIVFSACTAGIGNSIVTETKEKNFSDLNTFTFIVFWIATFCSCCFLNLYQPFVRIWVGEELLLRYPAVICFVAYFCVHEINQLLNLYKDAGGIWHKDRFRPLVTALVNLAMNLSMVHVWGIYGVLLSTILSMLFVGMPWLFHNLFTTLFERPMLRMYIITILKYTISLVLVCLISVIICNFIQLNDWQTLVTRMILCCIIPNVLLMMRYRNSSEFIKCINLVNFITKGKIALLKNLEGVKH